MVVSYRNTYTNVAAAVYDSASTERTFVSTHDRESSGTPTQNFEKYIVALLPARIDADERRKGMTRQEKERKRTSLKVELFMNYLRVGDGQYGFDVNKTRKKEKK